MTNKKGQGNEWWKLIGYLIAAAGFFLILFVIYKTYTASNQGSDIILGPKCEDLGGVCQIQKCTKFVENNGEKGAFRCDEDKYCCIKPK